MVALPSVMEVSVVEASVVEVSVVEASVEPPGSSVLVGIPSSTGAGLAGSVNDAQSVLGSI
jgi:hypothetical protein